MDVQAIRAELAGFAPAGWTGYATTPGNVQLPAVVAGFPNRITPVSDSVFRIDLPMLIVIGNPYTPESEGSLLAAAVDVAAAYKAVQGTAFRSATWVSTDNFRPVSVGGVDAVGAEINLVILAS